MHLQSTMPAMVATGGYGDNGLGGGGLLALALLAGRGGFGFGNDGFNHRGEGCVTPSNLTAGLAGVTDAIQNTEVMASLGDIKASVPLAESQVQLALAGAQADITQQNQAQTLALSGQFFSGQLANIQGFANTKDAVDSLSTQVAIGQGVTNTNIERLGWQLSKSISDDGEKTRALITNNRIAELEQQLTVAQLNEREERANNARIIDRQSVEISMINNQNQNQLQFQQQQQALNTISSGLVQALQNIQATNQAINIGGSQNANPTNTNTNVRA